MAKYPLSKITTLPELVQDNFYSGDINSIYAEDIFPQLDATQTEQLKDLVMDVYYKAVKPEAFAAAVKELLKDDAKAKDIAIKVLGYDLLPIADYLGADIAGLISKLGGDPLTFRRTVPVRDVVERILENADPDALAFGDERLTHRLDNILRSFVVGARKDEQALEMLKGNPKTSGLGLDDAKASALLAIAKEELRTLEQRGVVVVPDEQYDREMAPEVEVATLAEPSPQPKAAAASRMSDAFSADDAEEIASGAGYSPTRNDKEETHTQAAEVRAQPTQQPTAATASRAGDAFSADDAEEIVIIRKRLPEKVDVKVVGEVTTLEDDLAQEIVRTTGASLPNEDLRNRFLYAVRLYIRDIRDELETKSKLITPVTSGGIGLAEDEATRIMGVLKAKLGSLRGIMEGKFAKERAAHVTARADKHHSEPDKAQKAEEGARDALYKDLTGKPIETAAGAQGVPAIKERKPAAPSVMTVIPVVGRDAPRPPQPDLSKLTVPQVHEVGSHVVAVADLAATMPLATVAAAPPAPRSPNEVVLAPRSPNEVVPAARTAPPPPGLPVVDTDEEAEFSVDDDEEPLVVHEVSDVMRPHAAPAPRSPSEVVPAPPPSRSGSLSDIAPASVPRAASPVPPPAQPRPATVPVATKPSAAPIAAAMPPRPPAPRREVPAPIPAAKPIVSDVTTAPKLVGPTEALRSMTIQDFRRLSKDPKEATLKIKDKLDLLGEESFEHKTDGIKAWQASVPNKTYLAMLRMSLEGEPVPQVIAKLQAAGKPLLSKEEFDAIMELNRDLRFG